MSSDLVIDVSDVTKKFGDKTVVNGIGLQVRQGEIYGFLGPNGSGKTTFIRMLCGLLTPDAGSGTCLGYDVRTQQADIKRHVGYMTQKFSFYEDLSIRENLDFIARIYGVPGRHEAVEGSLKRLGLHQRSHQLAGQLSGGWKQRLALAACLIHTPRLLLLDEPTAGVDPKARREFWDEIHQLSAGGLTVLITTHYMDEAERCHRLAILERGRLVADGSPRDLMAALPGPVLLVECESPRAAQTALQAHAGVLAAAQIGASLRVLTHAAQPGAGNGEDSAALVRSHLAAAQIEAKVAVAQPNLEDVFVVATRKAEPEGATQ
jgi:ABC-2 type transport system ATP-binding protein